MNIGARGRAVVKALCYKPEGRGSRPDEENYFFFNLPNPSGLTRPWGLSRNEYQKQKMFLGSKVRPLRMADNLAAIFEPIV
jgi:hypothetical protein